MAERGFCPFAVVRNIPPGANDPAIVPRLAILHVDAGNADSLFDFFNGPSGGIESHFFVKKDGVLEQYRSIYFQADANLDANDFAVSIETQGFGAGQWTAAQLSTIKRLLKWLHAEADIPLRKVQRWDGSGVGYHVMFGAPGHWTPVAKTCPGPDRIVQFNEILVPWLNRQAAGVKKPDFLAATWNVFHGTPITTLEPILTRLRKADVSLFLIQEGTNPELFAMLGRAGLEAVRQGQNVVAYDLNLWPSIAEKRVVLSDKTFQRANGEESPPVVSPSVILSDRQGRTLTALSYHLPPHVQVGGEVNPGVPKRVEITEDAMATMRDLASAAKTRAILFGGDDNFDERRGVWDKLRMAFTGLRLVQAPNPTHGDRKIDDFRVKGLEPGRGWTPEGGGDHKVHVRGFTWK